MKKIFLSFIELLLKPLYGKKQTQSFFNTLYFISLRGLNFRNDDMDKNGELHLLQKISAFYTGSKKLILFDVGANVGKYSTHVINSFSSHTYSLYSFEPVKKTFEMLKANMKNLNAKNISLFNFGLGNVNKQLPIYADHESSPLASLFKRDLQHENVKMTAQKDYVDIRTLPSFCEDEKITHIHFLKLDTEGSEYDILTSAKKMITDQSIDFIQFEFGATCMENKIYFKDLYTILSGHYKIYRLLKNGLYEYPEYHNNQEILSLATYLAVSKNIKGFI